MSEPVIKRGNGHGYISARTGKTCMIRCFECGAENYAMSVPSGFCAWCEHDANHNPTDEKKEG